MKSIKKFGAVVSMALVVSGAMLLGAGCMEQELGEEALDEGAVENVVENASENAVGETSQEVGTAATCELHIGPLTRSGNVFTGYGSMANCGALGSSTIAIQRERFLGTWENVASATIRGSGHDVYVRYNCTGTGTHTFRARNYGTTVGGEWRSKESNKIRLSCN